MKPVLRHVCPVLLLLFAQMAPAMAAEDAPSASTSGGITEIILERTWCYGACPVSTLVLHADGKAEYAGKENTPLTGQFAGAFPSARFDQLSRWLVAEGFFELQGSYGMPNVDASSNVIRVTRGGERKSVINNAFDSSLKLWGMEAIIQAIAADIQWQPVHSGIRGEVMWKSPGEDWRPQPGGFIPIEPEQQGFTPSGTRERYPARLDEDGRFEIPLAPGTYRIMWPSPRAVGQTVVVEPDRFTDVNLRHEHEEAADTASNNNTAMPAGLPPPPPGDGLYLRAPLVPAQWMLHQEQRMYLLGERREPAILESRLESDSVDNTTFRLALSIPYDATVTGVSHYLIVGGTVHEHAGGGSRGQEISLLFFRILGEERAREVAKYFGITVGYYSKPDYKLRVSLTPTKQSFARGESVTATLRIVNAGAEAVAFSDGISFGSRRDDYTFSAQRNGQSVADISFSGDRGGAAVPHMVLPGATFEDTVNLSKWFEFKEAGSYDVRGSYQLNFHDSRDALRIESRSVLLPSIFWTEHAEADFVVVIE